MAGFGAGCGRARCGYWRTRLARRPIAGERDRRHDLWLYSGRSRTQVRVRAPRARGIKSVSQSSHNGPQRRTTNRFQQPIPPPCERILAQCRRHSSHWHHCTVADGRPAHVKSYESRGTYPTTHATCGISAGNSKPAGICGDTHANTYTTGGTPLGTTPTIRQAATHVYRYIRNADTYATCGRPTVTIRNSPDIATCVCHDIHNRQNTTVKIPSPQQLERHACRDKRFLRNDFGKTMLPHAYG